MLYAFSNRDANSPSQETDKWFRLLVANTQDYAIFTTDTDGTLLTWNPGVEHILGYTAEEWIGKNASIIFTPEDQEQNVDKQEMAQAIAQGRASDIRWHIRKDGVYFWAEGKMTALYSDTGDLLGFGKILTDATERKIYEEKLRAAHEHSIDILESISDAFYAVDRNFNFTYVNRKAEELWGRRREDLIGRNCWTELPGIVGSESYEMHLHTARERVPAHYETISPVIGRPIEISIYPTSDGGLSVYFRDISERKKREQREQFLTELIERTRRLSDPDSIISETVQAVGKYLDLSRFFYADIDEDSGIVTIHHDWHSGKQIESVEGRWPLAAWSSVLPELQSGQTVPIADLSVDLRTAQEYEPMYAPYQVRAAVRIPVLREGKLVAMFSAQSPIVREWLEEEIALLEQIAERSHLTLENTLLLRQAQEQAQAEHARAEREAVLAEIGKAIRSSLTPAHIQTVTVEALGKALRADRCYFASVDIMRDTVVIGKDYHAEGIPPLAGTYRLSQFAVDILVVFGGGKTLVAPDTQAYSELPWEEQTAAVLEGMRVRAMVNVPFHNEQGELAAALGVAMADQPRQWTAEEIDFIEQIATEAREAVAAVRLQMRERAIATQLQEALIPSLPPRLPGLALQAFYRPALEEAGVGGDFWDVFSIGEGCSALIVADVSGKGLNAASQLAILRNMTRFALYTGTTVTEAIAQLDNVLDKQDLLSGFATLFFAGVYDHQQRTLNYVNCGQEPALIWRANTDIVELLEASGPVVGGYYGGNYQHRVISLFPGDILAIFTDGLTDAGPTRSELLEIGGVVEIFQTCCREITSKETGGGDSVGIAQEITSALIARVDAFARGGIPDDIALLVGVAEGGEYRTNGS